MSGRPIWVIDGYNAIRRIPQLDALFRSDMRRSREALVRHCRERMAGRRDLGGIWVVFDGSGAVADAGHAPAGLRVIFTRKGETADRRILDLIRDGRRGEFVVLIPK